MDHQPEVYPLHEHLLSVQHQLSCINQKLQQISDFLGIPVNGSSETKPLLHVSYITEAVLRRERKLSKPFMKHLRQKLLIGIKQGKNIVYTVEDIEKLNREICLLNQEKSKKIQHYYYPDIP